MRDLAPDITRQRLLIEGFYSVALDEAGVVAYLTGVASHLGLRTYGEPVVHSPTGTGSESNQGFDAFIPLIDSGISLYVWSNQRFFSAFLYTCKRFDTDAALSFTMRHFRSQQLEHHAF